MLIATKLDRLLPYPKELQPIISHDTLIMLSYEIKWQTKPIISPLTQFLSKATLKLGMMVSYCN